MPASSGLKFGIYAVFVASLVSGCSSLADERTGALPVPESVASDRELPLRPQPGPSLTPPGAEGVPDYAEALSLRDAIGRTLTFSPAVKAAFIEIDAKRGEEVQAAVRPNPELMLEVENFARNRQDNNTTESTLSFAQTVELGDKRLKRLQAAHLDASLSGWDYETVRVNAATNSAQAFVDVLIAQDRIKVLSEFVTIAEKTRSGVDARVKGGKASPIELDRAGVALARAKALLQGEKARLEAARIKLSALWGAKEAGFGRATGRLNSSHDVPSADALLALLDNNPALARWNDEIGRRVAQLDLEQSRAIPDLKVGAGVRRFEEDDSTAMVASVSMPIPVFDRNQGNIAAAHRRIAKAENDQLATRNELYAQLVEAVGELKVAATQLRAFEKDVLPGALQAYERTRIGFDEGKFDILNVLDVQRTVFETRLEVLSARAEYEKARVRVEALVGRDLNGL